MGFKRGEGCGVERVLRKPLFCPVGVFLIGGEGDMPIFLEIVKE